ncbi:MAG: hypothetical protein ACUZ8O_14165 [Candidatus Anammoxibacter sp.]
MPQVAAYANVTNSVTARGRVCTTHGLLNRYVLKGNCIKVKAENKNANLKNRKKCEDFSRIEIDKIFDIGIEACDQKDVLKVCKVLDTLKGMLNLQYKEVASGFNRLYDFCLKFVNDKKFENTRDILFELRQSWNVAVVTNSNNTKDTDI